MAIETDGTHIILSNHCSIDNAQALCDTLLTQTEQGEGDVTIDGHAVESIDIATLQILWSAIKTLKNSDRKLTFTDTSPAFQQAMEESGLVNHQV